jgi:signal transduction histidine kinase
VSSGSRAWLVFAACLLVIAVALGWVSLVAIRLERAELSARTESQHRESVRFALWRMDSWLSMFVGREAARPYSDYLPASASPPGESRSPSPLLALNSSYLPLHFQLDASGLTSPQVAPASPWTPNEPTPIAVSEGVARRERLDSLGPYLDLGYVQARVAAAESLPTTRLADLSMPTPDPSVGVPPRTEFEARASCTVPTAPESAWQDGVAVEVGPLIPLWLRHAEQTERFELVFVRRVEIGEGKLYQGFVVEWSALRAKLIEEASDLLPDADLVRVLPGPSSADPSGPFLANIPVALLAPPLPAPTSAGLTPTRTMLGLVWLLTLAAATAVGITLHKSVELGERRRRFVSAVTHELRTPLTTFKLYSEMLADGFVENEDQRREYLQTLKSESDRLANMVENVMTHARLEEKGTAIRTETLTVEALLERVTPSLKRQVASSGLVLRTRCATPGAAPIEVDPGSVGQVLQNLVENATKYGRNGEASPIDLSAALHNGSLSIEVRDHGPGIPTDQARAIFAPFDRGGRDSTDPQPGIGLGLSIARDLAHEMGGEVALVDVPGEGACFRLEVPAATRH